MGPLIIWSHLLDCRLTMATRENIACTCTSRSLGMAIPRLLADGETNRGHVKQVKLGVQVVTRPGPEQFVNFSCRSVHFVRMKLQFSSIPYSPIGHGDRSVRLVEFDQKVIELFRPWTRLLTA